MRQRIILMTNHRFVSRLALPVSAALLILLIIPTLTVIVLNQQQQQRLVTELSTATQKLQEHRQVAETLLARQRVFASQPQQQEPERLAGLALIGQAWTKDIALLSLELDARQQRVRVEVVAHSLDALLDFVSRLQNTRARVDLEQHQTENSLGEPWKIRATLNLEYSHAS